MSRILIRATAFGILNETLNETGKKKKRSDKAFARFTLRIAVRKIFQNRRTATNKLIDTRLILFILIYFNEIVRLPDPKEKKHHALFEN